MGERKIQENQFWNLDRAGADELRDPDRRRSHGIQVAANQGISCQNCYSLRMVYFIPQLGHVP